MKRFILTVIVMVTYFAVGAFAAPKKGTMKDPRDGKVYKTVQIGSQTWMAENLRVKSEGSWCYEGKESNCQKYGRLYNWDAAETACPAGWHLPTIEEFDALLVAVGENVANKKLKSTSGWRENGNGDDAVGFSALPAGGRDNDGSYYNEGKSAYFWSEDNGYGVYYMFHSFGSGRSAVGKYDEDDGFSVRCVKDK